MLIATALIADSAEKIESGSALVEQVAASARSMQDQTAALSEVVGAFKV